MKKPWCNLFGFLDPLTQQISEDATEMLLRRPWFSVVLFVIFFVWVLPSSGARVGGWWVFAWFLAVVCLAVLVSSGRPLLDKRLSERLRGYGLLAYAELLLAFVGVGLFALYLLFLLVVALADLYFIAVNALLLLNAAGWLRFSAGEVSSIAKILIFPLAYLTLRLRRVADWAYRK